MGGDLGGTGDDERGSRLVNQDGVDFIDDGEEVIPLHEGLGVMRHAHVAQVVEAELGVGSVGDVAGVLRTADIWRLIVLEASDGEAEPFVEMPHPLGVASGEVVVDGDQLGVASGQCVQVHREGGHQGLAFAGRHFGDLPLVEDNAAHDLDVEGHHIPLQLVAGDFDGVLLLARTLLEAPAGVLDHAVGLAHDVIGGLAVLEAFLELDGLRLEFFVGQRLILFGVFVDLVDQRPQLADNAFVAAGEQFLGNPL